MANSQIKTIDLKTTRLLFKQIQAIKAGLRALRLKVLDFLPAKYGCELWWEKSDARALKEIAGGQGVRFKGVDKVIEYLES